jgi:hypothetical protein
VISWRIAASPVRRRKLLATKEPPKNKVAAIRQSGIITIFIPLCADLQKCSGFIGK